MFEITESAKFVTLFYGKFNRSTKTLEYVNAGHNPPLHYRRRDARIEWLEASGTPLGMFEKMDYEARQIALEAGDILICYTDGLSEAEDADGAQFSKEQIALLTVQNANRGAQEIYDKLMDGVNEFRGAKEFDDDLTLVLCYQKGCKNDSICVISNDAKKQTNHSINGTGLSFFDKYFIQGEINRPCAN